MKEKGPARKQADILWRKHYHTRHVEWDRRGKTVEKRRAKNLSTKLGKNFKDKRTRDERDNERDLKAKPRNEMTEEEEYI